MRLRKERNRAGLTQGQLAGLSGVAQATISKLEGGTLLSPSYETLHKLAWALKKVGRKVEPGDLQPRKQLALIKGARALHKDKRTA